MTLNEVIEGRSVRVVEVMKAGDEARASRLEEIGFVAGERVSVYKKPQMPGSPTAIEVRGAIFGLGYEECAAIVVE